MIKLNKILKNWKIKSEKSKENIQQIMKKKLYLNIFSGNYCNNQRKQKKMK